MKHILAFLLLVLPALAQNPTRADLRVACVGDSITAGYALEHPERDAYPVQLARLLGPGWSVRNFGVSGATLMAAGDYPYVKQWAYPQALDWKPDVVVIALGTNDTKAWNIPKHPEDFVPSYRAMIAKFRAANPQAKILICLPPPAFPAAMGIAEDVLAARILPLIRQVAAEEKLPLIDLHEPLKSAAALFPDLIHPNPEGACRIAEIVYGEVMFATQPGAESLDPAVNTATIPAPRLELDCYNWWQRHAEELDLHSRIDPQVVLIGDSITHFWAGVPEQPNRRNGPEAWKKTFGSRTVVNLGFGWDRTQNALWRVEHGELDGYRPKLVVVNLGTNNFAGTENSRPNTPEEIAAGVAAVCDRVQAKCPGAQIVVMGVFPRGRTPDDPFRSKVAELNGALARILAGRAGVRFLEIGREFVASDGTIPESLMPDALHPSERGYEIWGNALARAGVLP